MKRTFLAAFIGILAILGVGSGLSHVCAQDSDCSYVGSISGIKFADYNGNGLRDAGEPGLPAWWIEIYDENGLLDSVVTDDNGAYSFTCVNPGQFNVREVRADGWVQTTPVDECFLPAPYEEEPLPLGPCYTIDMGPNGVLTGVNFANFEGIAVALDIKPQSCRNPLKFKATGTLPVAILGTDGFIVKNINMNTVRLEGVRPLRWSVEDVATPYYPLVGKKDPFDCTTKGPDGFKDVVMHFSMKDISVALGSVRHGEVRTIRLTGELLDGPPILGQDVVVILNPAE